MKTATVAAALLLAPVAADAASAREPAAAEFFDDFAHADLAALQAFGWTLRSAPGHPGVPGARWSPDALALDREGSTTLLRLTARTDGTPAGTQQAQLCHQRKVLHGTYAARLRFGNQPLAGAGGDPVVQSFYAVSPLKHDYDPRFSEVDWEYLAQGGWGSPATRLYAVTWQTVRIEPWDAHNAAHERPGRVDGWHTLLMQVRTDGRTHWFLDGRPLAVHGGRNQPVQPMAISFSTWFSPGGLRPPGAEPRVWAQEVDWVFHARGRTLSPAEVERRVRGLRRAGRLAVDSVPAGSAEPGRCDF